MLGVSSFSSQSLEFFGSSVLSGVSVLTILVMNSLMPRLLNLSPNYFSYSFLNGTSSSISSSLSSGPSHNHSFISSPCLVIAVYTSFSVGPLSLLNTTLYTLQSYSELFCSILKVGLISSTFGSSKGGSCLLLLLILLLVSRWFISDLVLKG
jgi:hypothetical protein